jgi:putative redox protein
MNVTAKWVDALAFDGVSDNGHTVRMDTTVEGGSMDSGMSPKKLLLASLCGCSGIDVVDILKKMKVDYATLEVFAEANQTTTHPMVFTSIHMVYKADVSPENLDKFKRAVALSHETYCGISAMLAKHCNIDYRIELF